MLTFHLDRSHLDTSAISCYIINSESWTVIERDRDTEDCKNGMSVTGTVKFASLGFFYYFFKKITKSI